MKLYKVKVPFILEAETELHARMILSMYLSRKGVPPRFEEEVREGKKKWIENSFGYEEFEVNDITQ